MKTKKRISFSTKIIIFLSAFLLIMDGALGAFLIVHSVNKMKSIIQNKLIETAQTAANLVNGDEIASLTINDTYENSEAYKRNFDILHSFKTSAESSNGELAYIYAVVKNDEGKIVFSLDPSDDPGQFLTEELSIQTDALRSAFEGVAKFDDKSYVDKWGDLISAYAPVKGADGTVKAVIGADIWSSYYNKEITSNALLIGGITLATIAIGIGTCIIVTQRVRRKYDALSNEMIELQSDVNELFSNIRDPEFKDAKIDNKKNNSDDQVAILRKQIGSTREELKHYIDYTHRQAYLDSMSGLYNRNAYVERIKNINKDIADKNQKPFTVLLFDIDYLKEINDKYGHESGDKVIIVASRSVAKIFGTNNTYRIGDDEIVAISSDTREESTKLKLDMFKEALLNGCKENKLDFVISVSCGYSVFNKNNDTSISDVFNKADKMMYKLKDKYHKDNPLPYK